MPAKIFLLAVSALLLAASCASTTRLAKDLSAGSCQRECAAKNPDSFYDQQRCVEELCSPPKQD